MRRLAAGSLLALALAGCGTSVDGADTIDAPGGGAVPEPRQLPERPADRLDVDGDTQSSLSFGVAKLLEADRPGLVVEIGGAGAGIAFQELCDGQIDAVDSARPISVSELERCRRNGVRPVSFVVAADAVVVGVRNEADVGVDCLSVAQVGDLYRRDTNVRNWKQSHGFDLPLRVTGPAPGVDGYALFAEAVLGDPAAGLADIRSDYVPRKTDRAIRETVVGTEQARVNAPLRDEAEHDLAELRRAIADKDAAVLRARRNVAKSERDGWAPDERRAAAATLDRLTAQMRGLRRSLAPARAYAARAKAAEHDLATRRGWAGGFRFAYYELFEEQLRPIEVTRRDDPRFDCVFPSPETITSGAYPLARQLRITATREGLRRGEIRTFLDTYLRNAQSMAKKADLVPLSDGQVTRARAQARGDARIDDAQAGG